MLHPSQGYEGNVGSPLSYIILPIFPLSEETFPAPNLEVPPTKCDGGRQLLGKSSSDEPSRNFYVGTSEAQHGMSVRETPTKHFNVHQSPQHPKTSERATSDRPTECLSETPKIPQTINLSDYVTKAEFEHQILIRDQKILSLKDKLRLTEAHLAQTQSVVSSIQKKLASLSTPSYQSREDDPTEGEKVAREKV